MTDSLTHLVTTWKHEMLAHLKIDISVFPTSSSWQQPKKTKLIIRWFPPPVRHELHRGPAHGERVKGRQVGDSNIHLVSLNLHRFVTFGSFEFAWTRDIWLIWICLDSRDIWLIYQMSRCETQPCGKRILLWKVCWGFKWFFPFEAFKGGFQKRPF